MEQIGEIFPQNYLPKEVQEPHYVQIIPGKKTPIRRRTYPTNMKRTQLKCVWRDKDKGSKHEIPFMLRL